MYENFFIFVLVVLFLVPWIAWYFTGKVHSDCQNVSTFHFLLHTIFCLWKLNLMWTRMLSSCHFNVWVWCKVLLLRVTSQYCRTLSCYCNVGIVIYFAHAMVCFFAGGANFLFYWRYPSLGCCDIANDSVVCGLVRMIIIVLWVVTNVYPTHHP